MKNLAGHHASIFLYRFVLRGNGISFVLNEQIAEDLYPQTEEELAPFVHACCETLLRYKELCRGETIMDGHILVDGHFEVMLYPGMGQYFVEEEKQNLFQDAHRVAELLMDVIDRRSKELDEGTYPGPQPVISHIQRTGMPNQQLERLGERKRVGQFWAESQTFSRSRLSPNDLPNGVIAKDGYDHRGPCLTFEHESLGFLGKIVLSSMGPDTLMQTEVSREQSEYLEDKKAVLEQVIAVIETALNGE